MTDIRKQFYENIDSFWHDLYDEEYALYDIKVEKAEKIKQVKTAADQWGMYFLKQLIFYERLTTKRCNH